MVARAIEDRDVEETLDSVDALWVAKVDADAEMFELAAHFADLHSAESLPRGRRVLPGMERAVRLGGDGTPLVAEFAAAEFGARMRMGSWGARSYIADALDVRHRLPLLWAKVCSREARIGHVRLVAARTRHLGVDAAAYVDAAMADHADGSVPWARFEARLTGKIVAADPELAAEREAASAAEQFARRTRSSEDGTAGFYVRSTIGVIARIEATVAYVADALAAFGDLDDLDRRRVKAVALLSNPTKAVELLAAFAAMRSRAPSGGDDPGADTDDELPLERPDDAMPSGNGPASALDRMDAFARRVGFRPAHLPSWLRADRPGFRFDWSGLLPPLTLNLHLSADSLRTGPDARGSVVRWEREGPVTLRHLREVLGPLHALVVQPVIDLAHLAPVDGYEIPDRHRRAVHLRTPADISPYSSSVSRDVDIDHTEAWRPAPEAGRAEPLSAMANYGPLGRFGHRVKTHGRWILKQPFHGIYLWRDPHGQVYLVDHTGTHKVTRPSAPAGPARSFDPDVELYPADVVLEVEPAR